MNPATGDEAEIIDPANGTKLLGVITSIKHRFGKRGSATEFVVDSGGRKGKLRFKQLVEEITSKGQVGTAKRI